MRAIRTSGSVRGGLPGETGVSTGFTPRMAGQDVPGVERPRRAEPPTRQDTAQLLIAGGTFRGPGPLSSPFP